MSTPVITIARQLGSHGDALGFRLAQHLGIPLLAQEILELAAQEAGVSLETIAEAERVPSWTERVLDAIGRSMSLEPLGAPMMPSTLDRLVASSDFRQIIQDVVRGLAARGPCVIIGHAGQIALRDTPNVLRVYLHAPAELRAQRLAAERNISVERAALLVVEDDKQRKDLFWTYYGVRWDDPELYVLTLDTGVLEVDVTTEVVLHVAQHMAGAG